MMTSLFFLGILQTDKDLYFLSLMAQHCEIWYLGTYFVDLYLSYCIENGKKSCRSSNDDVINLNAIIRIHIRFYFTSSMACRSETWYFGVFHVSDGE